MTAKAKSQALLPLSALSYIRLALKKAHFSSIDYLGFAHSERVIFFHVIYLFCQKRLPSPSSLPQLFPSKMFMLSHIHYFKYCPQNVPF